MVHINICKKVPDFGKEGGGEGTPILALLSWMALHGQNAPLPIFHSFSLFLVVCLVKRCCSLTRLGGGGGGGMYLGVVCFVSGSCLMGRGNGCNW